MMQIKPMKETDIPDAIKLWEARFEKYCYAETFPDFRSGGIPAIENYLKNQIKNDNAVIAVKNNSVTGYMAWMYVDFHNERSTFLPITGHAGLSQDEIEIYEELYYYASRKWVADNRFNHLWMTYYDDEALKNRLYDFGFGSYVVDACQAAHKNIKTHCDYTITVASMDEADSVLEFENSSMPYYASAPIFLKRKPRTHTEIAALIKDGYALVARDSGKIVGLMNVTVKQDYDLEYLTVPGSAYIGAFVHRDYRGKGIGSALLAKAFELCRAKGMPYVHLGFETANPNAVKFWPRYFRPVIRSVRRTVNKDANFIV